MSRVIYSPNGKIITSPPSNALWMPFRIEQAGVLFSAPEEMPVGDDTQIFEQWTLNLRMLHYPTRVGAPVNFGIPGYGIDRFLEEMGAKHPRRGLEKLHHRKVWLVCDPSNRVYGSNRIYGVTAPTHLEVLGLLKLGIEEQIERAKDYFLNLR